MAGLKKRAENKENPILKAWWFSIYTYIRIGGRNVPRWMWMRHH